MPLLARLAALIAPSDAKASRTAVVQIHAPGRPVWSGREGLARAYQRNPVVHRCVRLVAEAAAGLPLVLKDGRGAELARHPALDLLARPNAGEGGVRFLEGLLAHLLLSGNAYAELVSLEGRPAELHALRPDRVQVVPGSAGWPEGYEYRAGGRVVRFSVPPGGPSPILHLALFHPGDDHYGLSPLEAAGRALDLHEQASAWNKALLDNGARPSGALVHAGPNGTPLTDHQFARLKAELERSYQGAGNAGRPLLLDGGLAWQPLSLSPKDLDFLEAKNGAAREIALAFGVPPLLLGLPGDNTHANYAEANRAFYRQGVIPLATRTASSLAHWLSGHFGEPLHLAPDLDAIEALATERESLWRRVEGASFLTQDEKREAVGYGPATGA